MENFKILPVRNIIDVLKKMDARTFSRAYQTCRDMKEIADKARAEIKIDPKDNNGNGFGINFTVYASEKIIDGRIYKPVLNVKDSPLSLEPLYEANPKTEDELNDFFKYLSFFNWETVNLFPCGVYCYTNEETYPSLPVLIYIDWIFKALKKNYIVCEKLKSPPNWNVKEALRYLRVRNWHARGPCDYERRKMDWIKAILETDLISRNITFSIILRCYYINDLPKLLSLFDYLDISMEDTGYSDLGPLNTSLAALDLRLNHLRHFPRPQEVRFGIWSQFGYQQIQPRQFLNVPFLEYTGFADAAEIKRRGLKWAPTILHIPTVDTSQHIVMVMFQGETSKKTWIPFRYLKIYYVVVNDWEKWLKKWMAHFQPKGPVPADNIVNQFDRDYFELYS